jgi:hypothetical protein
MSPASGKAAKFAKKRIRAIYNYMDLAPKRYVLNR